jgi:hypothetical protein
MPGNLHSRKLISVSPPLNVVSLTTPPPPHFIFSLIYLFIHSYFKVLRLNFYVTGGLPCRKSETGHIQSGFSQIPSPLLAFDKAKTWGTLSPCSSSYSTLSCTNHRGQTDWKFVLWTLVSVFQKPGYLQITSGDADLSHNIAPNKCFISTKQAKLNINVNIGLFTQNLYRLSTTAILKVRYLKYVRVAFGRVITIWSALN